MMMSDEQIRKILHDAGFSVPRKDVAFEMFMNAARAIEQAARREALMDAEKTCRSHMENCLFDKDIQKHWLRIKRENDTYGDLIRNLAKQPKPD